MPDNSAKAVRLGFLTLPALHQFNSFISCMLEAYACFGLSTVERTGRGLNSHPFKTFTLMPFSMYVSVIFTPHPLRGVSEELGKQILQAIHKGEVPHVSIKF